MIFFFFFFVIAIPSRELKDSRANIADQNEVAHDEPPHMDLHCLPRATSLGSILNKHHRLLLKVKEIQIWQEEECAPFDSISVISGPWRDEEDDTISSSICPKKVI